MFDYGEHFRQVSQFMKHMLIILQLLIVSGVPGKIGLHVLMNVVFMRGNASGLCMSIGMGACHVKGVVMRQKNAMLGWTQRLIFWPVRQRMRI